jgi:hypothetical protein
MKPNARRGALVRVAVSMAVIASAVFITGAPDRILSAAECAASQGAAWPYDCYGGATCVQSGGVNNGYGGPNGLCAPTLFVPCPSGGGSYYTPCVLACQDPNGLSGQGGLCLETFLSHCTDTTNINSPGICGQMTLGQCTYQCIQRPGISWCDCQLTAGCAANGSPPAGQCGVMKTCN